MTLAKRCLLSLTVILGVAIADRLVSGGPALPLEPAAPGAERLKVLTYNVNFGIAGDAETLQAIERSGADLVFLQETTPDWHDAITHALGGRYPHMAEMRAPAAGGQMILSRWPFEVKETTKSPVRWFPATRLVAETPLGNVQVLNVHLHPPVSKNGSWVLGYFTTGADRLAEIEAFAKNLDPRLPTLVVGDFNEGGGGNAVRFLEERGARDAVSDHLGRRATWRWPFGAVTLRLQLDHVLYRGALRPVDVEVREEGNSDHLPVAVTFVREPPEGAAPGMLSLPCPSTSPTCLSTTRSD